MQQLERRTCANGVLNGAVTLATRVASAPTTSCAPSGGCPGLPTTVAITVVETNQPSTGAQYRFTLTASVRSDGQLARDSTNSQGSPLLVLGGSCSAGAGFSVGGSTTFIVNGVAAIDATDGPGCTAMTVSGGAHGYGADGTSIGTGGSCGPDHCPLWTSSSAVGNPFASLTPPSTAGCGSGTNPPAVAGVYQPG